MTSHAIEFTAVVPCYNEEDNLETLYTRLTKALESLQISYEIILVDDGSRDATWLGLQALALRDKHVTSLRLSRNFGHEMALSAGLSHARGEMVVILDADLQDPPELLPQMIDVMKKEKADVVYGQRVKRDGETWFKKLSAKAFYRIINKLSDVEMPVDTGDFRLMRKKVVDAFNAMPEANRYVRGMVSWLGFKQVAFPFERAPRHAGVTQYNLRRMVRLALDGIIGFSHRPLRITFYLGIFLALCSGLTMLYLLYNYIAGSPVSGWTSLMGVILILQSFQFIVLGVFGEYLGRLFVESKHRPLFIISEVHKHDNL